MRKLGLFNRGISCGAPVNSRNYGGCGVGVNSAEGLNAGTGGRGTITRGVVDNNVIFKQKSMATGAKSQQIPNNEEMINGQPPVQLTSYLPYQTSTETSEWRPPVATGKSKMASNKPQQSELPQTTYIIQEARSNDRNILESWIAGNSLLNKPMPGNAPAEVTQSSSRLNTNFTNQGSSSKQGQQIDQSKLSEFAHYQPFPMGSMSTHKLKTSKIQHPEIQQIPVDQIYLDRPIQQNLSDKQIKHQHESRKVWHEPPTATQVSFENAQLVPQFTKEVSTRPTNLYFTQVGKNSKAHQQPDFDNPNKELVVGHRHTMHQLEASQRQPVIKEDLYVQSPQLYELQGPNMEQMVLKEEVQSKKPNQQYISHYSNSDVLTKNSHPVRHLEYKNSPKQNFISSRNVPIQWNTSRKAKRQVKTTYLPVEGLPSTTSELKHRVKIQLPPEKEVHFVKPIQNQNLDQTGFCKDCTFDFEPDLQAIPQGFHANPDVEKLTYTQTSQKLKPKRPELQVTPLNQMQFEKPMQQQPRDKRGNFQLDVGAIPQNMYRTKHVVEESSFPQVPQDLYITKPVVEKLSYAPTFQKSKFKRPKVPSPFVKQVHWEKPMQQHLPDQKKKFRNDTFHQELRAIPQDFYVTKPLIQQLSYSPISKRSELQRSKIQSPPMKEVRFEEPMQYNIPDQTGTDSQMATGVPLVLSTNSNAISFHREELPSKGFVQPRYQSNAIQDLPLPDNKSNFVIEQSDSRNNYQQREAGDRLILSKGLRIMTEPAEKPFIIRNDFKRPKEELFTTVHNDSLDTRGAISETKELYYPQNGLVYNVSKENSPVRMVIGGSSSNGDHRNY